MKQLQILLLFAFFIHASNAARILCLFPFDGWSHHVTFDVLCKGLAKKGHQIDMISHFPSKTRIANYTDIVDLRGTKPTIVGSFTVEKAKNLHPAITYHVAKDFGYEICKLMGHERMQKFIKSAPNDRQYDLILTEYFGLPCYLGFGELLKAPVAITITMLEMPHVDNFMANPPNYAFFPNFFVEKPVVETFFDRLWNFLSHTKYAYLFRYYTSDQTEMMREYLGMPDLPDVRELEKKVSLALVNAHYSFFGIRPLTPAFVEIGGLHIAGEQPELSPELKNWLDTADHGVVLFTLGSLTQIESFPTDTLLNFYAAFRKIAPIKVLMKCINTTKLPPGLPKNVMTTPWVPQIPVLKHKNTRLFITHGGLLGTEEAVYYGVPMIGIPLFSDQIRNVNILVQKNVGRLLHLDDISKDTLDAALHALLHDPKYRESAKKISRMFRDRPLSAMDTATFWIEYVIRHGPDSLKSPAVDLSWCKRNMIDVFAFLITCFVLMISVLVLLLKTLFKIFRKRKTVQTEKKIK